MRRPRAGTAELAPRLLSKCQAAAYCGVGSGLFASHCPVIPIKLGGRVLYDRVAIDKWIDARSSNAPESAPHNVWLERLDSADANKRN